MQTVIKNSHIQLELLTALLESFNLFCDFIIKDL